MKITRAILTIILFFSFSVGFAQDPERKHSLGLYQNFTDYNVVLLQDKLFAFDSSLSQTTRIAYQRRLSRTFMLNTGISNGFILNQTIRESFVEQAYVLGIDAALHFKINNGRIMKENPIIAPYLTFGYRMDYVPKLATIDDKPYIFLNQYGFGFNLKVSKRTHIQLQAVLDQKLSSDFNTHMQYRAGITQSIGPLEEKLPKKSESIDTDEDGIVDVLDKCPTLFGLEEAGGCPDTLWAQNKDSLQQIVVDQRAELDQLQLELAELRKANDGTDVSKTKEQELLLQIYKLRKSKDEEILALKKQLAAIEQNSKPDVDVALAEKQQKEREYQEKLAKEREAELAKNATKPAVTSKQKTADIIDYPPIPEDKNYYVITISSPNLTTSQRWLVKFKKDYDDAMILPQPNGYYRVGIYAGKDKPKALRIMEEVRKQGYEKVWLSVE